MRIHGKIITISQSVGERQVKPPGGGGRGGADQRHVNRLGKYLCRRRH